MKKIFNFKKIILLFIILGAGSWLLINKTFIVKAQAPSNAVWYMAGANAQRTSWVNDAQVPAGNLSPQWFKPIEPYIPHNFQIVAGNDMIFVSTARGLYALDTDGNLKWVYPTEMPLGQSPTYVETSFSPHPKRLYIPGLDHKIHCIDANPSANALQSVTIPQSNNTVQYINNNKCWTNDFEAKADGIGAGFMTNPLVLNISGIIYIYAGNRDGYMYALKDNGTSVSLAWTYKTDGPIMFSTAASYPNSSGQYDANTKIYFASNDSYAYSLNATTGWSSNCPANVCWKSPKLPGAGFNAYWPVVYKHSDGKEYVLLAGSHNYRDSIEPGVNGHDVNLEQLDREIFWGEGYYGDARTDGTLIGLLSGGGWIDTNQKATGADRSITSYYQGKRWRRTYFVLDDLGHEANFDTSPGNSNNPDYAPFGWLGSQSGNRYPSVIMQDNNIYQTALYNTSIPHDINQGAVLKWQFGTPLVSKVVQRSLAVDEPLYIAAGGNTIYFNWWGGFVAGATNTSQGGTEQIFYDHDCNYGGCGDYWASPNKLFPGYEEGVDGLGGRVINGVVPSNSTVDIWAFGESGSYDRNGDGNPPIPYKDKIFWHDSNSILVMGTTLKSTGTKLTPAWTVEKQDFPSYVNSFNPNVSVDVLKQKLENEIKKFDVDGNGTLDHLYAGYFSSGHIDNEAHRECGDNLQDYFHNTADTLWALSLAMPYLSTSTQNSLKTYMTNEYNSYNPFYIYHIGFAAGATRSWYDIPDDLKGGFASNGVNVIFQEFTGWEDPPYIFYGLWQYAKSEGMNQTDARILFNSIPWSPDTTPPADSTLQLYPFVHNAYLSGYYGYMELQKKAGYPESTSIRSSYTSLLAKRATLFDKNRPSSDPVYGWPQASSYCNAYNASRNFMFLAPEVAKDLAANSTYLNKVRDAINGLRVANVYGRDMAYWFVSGFDDTYGEAIHEPLYDATIFQAKAYVLGDKREELLKYLDVPGFARGDLFYIQNLVTVIEALPAGGATPTSGPSPTPTPACGPPGDIDCSGHVNFLDLSRLLSRFGETVPAGAPEDIDGSLKVNSIDLTILLSNFGL